MFNEYLNIYTFIAVYHTMVMNASETNILPPECVLNWEKCSTNVKLKLNVVQGMDERIGEKCNQVYCFLYVHRTFSLCFVLSQLTNPASNVLVKSCSGNRELVIYAPWHR